MPYLFLLLLLMQYARADWGFFAHKKINQIAIYALPKEELLIFYKKNQAFIVEKATAPDVRRTLVEGEDAKHFIDLDHYEDLGNPLEILPKNWEKPLAFLPEDSLKKHGIAPWNLVKTYYQLVNAFKSKNKNTILRISADIGHYCGDIHVPLHTTKNYNGQLTDQRGIHGLFESRIPEVFANDYHFFLEKAKYIPNITKFTWQIIEQTHQKVATVLAIEKHSSSKIPADQKYSYEKRGNTTVKVYSKIFISHYQDALEGMIEEQMKKSMEALASLWYSAWVDAGQPDLSNLEENISADTVLKKEKIIHRIDE